MTAAFYYFPSKKSFSDYAVPSKYMTNQIWEIIQRVKPEKIGWNPTTEKIPTIAPEKMRLRRKKSLFFCI
jgi:hypothetical protein